MFNYYYGIGRALRSIEVIFYFTIGFATQFSYLFFVTRMFKKLQNVPFKYFIFIIIIKIIKYIHLMKTNTIYYQDLILKTHYNTNNKLNHVYTDYKVFNVRETFYNYEIPGSIFRTH